MKKFDWQEVALIKQVVSQWLELYHQNWNSNDPAPTPADASHSALLERLLRGQPPLPKPPPLRYSYPSYRLGEGERVEINEFNEYKDYVCIDQSSNWTWYDRDKKMLVHSNGDLYQLTEESGGKKFLQRIV